MVIQKRRLKSGKNKRSKGKKARRQAAEVREIVLNLKLLDDVMFFQFARDPEAIEELLQVILEQPNLRVKPETLVPQKVVKNIAKRGVQVDAYIEGEEDIVYNIEIQKTNNCNHVKRVRYNASILTVNGSEPGDDFEGVQEVIVVYISAFDMFKKGKTIYHAEMTVQETGEPVKDGLKAVYVNTKINDGSKIAKLMSNFKKKDFQDEEFPKISKRMHEIKHSETESREMNQLVEEYARKRAGEEREEGRKETRIEMQIVIDQRDAEIAELKKQLEAMKAKL